MLNFFPHKGLTTVERNVIILTKVNGVIFCQDLRAKKFSKQKEKRARNGVSMKEILKAYRIQCYPNNVQKTLFRKNFGASRFAFNFALERKKLTFDKKERIPNAIELHRELNKLKGTDDLSWAYEVSKCSFQEALRDCDKAFNNFFIRCKKKIKGKKGFPKFKSKKNDKQSFRLTGSISVENGYCWLPRIGKIKLSESNYFNDNSKILSSTISRKAD